MRVSVINVFAQPAKIADCVVQIARVNVMGGRTIVKEGRTCLITLLYFRTLWIVAVAAVFAPIADLVEDVNCVMAVALCALEPFPPVPST